MATASLFFIFLIIVNAVTAFKPVVMITPTFNERAVSPPGGWGANQYNESCPAGSSDCEVGGCCPDSLSCLGTGDPVNVICCPENMSETDCENIFTPNPICADTTWTLWNSTTQGQYGGFFCCDEDQVGDQLGSCYPRGATAATDTISMAITVVPAMVLGTAPGSASATATTKNVGGFISSLVASVTGKETASATGASATGTSSSTAAKSSSAAAYDHHDLKWGGITAALGCLCAILL